MSDNRMWVYEPEDTEDSSVAFIGEHTDDGRMIRFVCEFIEPPSDADAALLVAGKNEAEALRARVAELERR